MKKCSMIYHGTIYQYYSRYSNDKNMQYEFFWYCRICSINILFNVGNRYNQLNLLHLQVGTWQLCWQYSIYITIYHELDASWLVKCSQYSFHCMLFIGDTLKYCPTLMYMTHTHAHAHTHTFWSIRCLIVGHWTTLSKSVETGKV